MPYVKGKTAPKWEPSKKDLMRCRHLAELGWTKAQIAEDLGITYGTLNEKQKEYPQISEAITQGRHVAAEAITAELYEAALEKDPKTGAHTSTQIRAIEIWLRNCFGWRDRVEHSSDKERPVIPPAPRALKLDAKSSKLVSDILAEAFKAARRGS